MRQRSQARNGNLDPAGRGIARYLEAERNKTKYVPDVTLFQALHALRGQVKVLFSDAAFAAFAHFESVIGPNLEKVPGEGVGSLDEYLRRRDAVLRAMYQDLGIVDRPRPPSKREPPR